MKKISFFLVHMNLLAKRFSSPFLHPGFDIEFRSWAELCALCVLVAEGLVLEFVMKRGTLGFAWPTELHIMDVSTAVRLHVSVTVLSLSLFLSPPVCCTPC